MEINCVVEHLNNLMREPTERDMNYLKIKFPNFFSFSGFYSLTIAGKPLHYRSDCKCPIHYSLYLPAETDRPRSLVTRCSMEWVRTHASAINRKRSLRSSRSTICAISPHLKARSHRIQSGIRTRDLLVSILFYARSAI